MKKTLKWFTLIEISIAIALMGMLLVSVFRSYNTIATIAARIEQEKILNNEILFLSQALDTETQWRTVDFSQYAQQDLVASNWYSADLFLTWGDGAIHIFAQGSGCNALSFWSGNGSCAIMMDKNGQITALTNPDLLFIKGLSFKIIPYRENLPDIVSLKDWYKPGFWIFWDFSIKRFGTNWSSNVSLSVQDFYSL